MGRTVVIAQARMSSTRLPGKTMMDLAGKPVLDHVIERAQRAESCDDVWVATTTDPTDDRLAEYLDETGLAYVRGDLDDVLSRYIIAAEASDAQNVVRITCDCPLIDPAAIDAVVSAFKNGPEVDYCSNTLRRTYPIGMDTEMFSRAALMRAHSEASHPHEREHVTPYLYQHPELFRLHNVEAPEWARWPELRLTVDEASDIEMLRALLGVAPHDAGLAELLDAIRQHPELVELNAAVAHRHMEKPAEW